MNKKIIMLSIFFSITLFGCSNNSSEDSVKPEKGEVQNKLNSKCKEEINTVNNKSDVELKNIDSNKNSVNNKIDVEEKTTHSNKTVQKGKTDIPKNQKQLYINKLNNVKAGLVDLDDKYKGTTVEMKQAAKEEYKRWDSALNEIYGVLKLQMSPSNMQELRKEQREWIDYRDNEAKKDSLEFKGGTMESLAYIASLGETTQKRCYELVEKYMK